MALIMALLEIPDPLTGRRMFLCFARSVCLLFCFYAVCFYKQGQAAVGISGF